MEKIGEIIKDYKEETEIFDENWINIHLIVNKTKEILDNDCEIKMMNWNNFTIIYKNNEYFVERTVFPNGLSKYKISYICR
jgi:hypothetical protein